ncbi:hypothetical protein SDC9_157971 [bioreactor metagenome]|uniref:Uncharacterized protein n=1 Tax=bioreactor metagenome TaxID=1076179 RepID=A0A645FDV4_9ZZZZ
MLLRQDGGRHQQRRLFSILNRLKDRPQRQLRLSVANVSAEQAIHGADLFHIRLDLLHALFLVGREFIGKTLLEGSLPRGVFGERKADGIRPLGIQRREIDRELLGRTFRLVDAVCPLRAAELAQRGRYFVLPAADIFLHAVELIGRDIEPVSAAVFDEQIISRVALHA